MSNNEALFGRNELFSMMNDGRPYKSYIKGILGQVSVVVWDNFEEMPLEIILKGNPKNRDEGSIVDVWSPKEDVFFNRVNKKHFNNGVLLAYTRPELPAVVEKTVEQSSDEELITMINSKFLAFQAKLNKINSIAVLFRIRGLAEDLEKSEKIIKAIEARISELQADEFSPKRVEGAEEE